MLASGKTTFRPKNSNKRTLTASAKKMYRSNDTMFNTTAYNYRTPTNDHYDSDSDGESDSRPILESEEEPPPQDNIVYIKSGAATSQRYYDAVITFRCRSGDAQLRQAFYKKIASVYRKQGRKRRLALLLLQLHQTLLT
ncbi:hypothetical protein K1T71_000518 [Dendrolimus kikuchii]|uniref:Uncharacterized protein n=1 Tax=Dendrolimus kikuchii TaxID=765133 RepID=A0ACC1DJL6_9NEOP|nr:hypothetical protein K1T71_000518 [Dendrolimus kikuchii]